MKKTFIIEVRETRVKYVAVELDDENCYDAKEEADEIAWSLAYNNDLDFKSQRCVEDIETKILKECKTPFEELWKDNEPIDVEDFRYKESFGIEKSFLE